MIPVFQTHNGVDIPSTGLGTYLAKDADEVERLICDAVDAGYTSFDTAMFYFNEGAIGRGIKSSGANRKELFITSKLWNDSHEYEKAIKAFMATLKRLDISYLDEYLIHWPGLNEEYLSAWKALETLHKDGLVRVIGVSNFTKALLRRLLDSCEIKPMVNQVEVNPLFQPNDAISFCRRHQILIEGYRPIIWGRLNMDPIPKIAEKYQKTCVQVTLRWLYQKGIRSLPKTTHKTRMIENIGIFDFALNPFEIERIDQLNTWTRTAESPDEFFWNGAELIEKHKDLGY